MVGQILLTGSTGQVGGELMRTLAPFAHIIAPTRAEMDLSRPESIRGLVREIKPRWIVNPAAYTAVDKAESEEALAFAINAESVAVLSDEAKRTGAIMLHFSTDYVFSGAGSTPYIETDVTSPASIYGASKLAGEQALAASGAAYLIFRTSWVYGANGKNFLLTILKLARERERLRIVADQHGAPTGSAALAQMTASVMERIEVAAVNARESLVETAMRFNGVYHASGSGETTWHGFATEALNQMRIREPESRFAQLDAISTEEYPTPARRPGNSRLNGAKLANTFGCTMPEWTETLKTVLDELTTIDPEAAY